MSQSEINPNTALFPPLKRWRSEIAGDELMLSVWFWEARKLQHKGAVLCTAELLSLVLCQAVPQSRIPVDPKRPHGFFAWLRNSLSHVGFFMLTYTERKPFCLKAPQHLLPYETPNSHQVQVWQFWEQNRKNIPLCDHDPNLLAQF